jgi:hypothetical protein
MGQSTPSISWRQCMLVLPGAAHLVQITELLDCVSRSRESIIERVAPARSRSLGSSASQPHQIARGLQRAPPSRYSNARGLNEKYFRGLRTTARLHSLHSGILKHPLTQKVCGALILFPYPIMNSSLVRNRAWTHSFLA